MFKPVQAAVVNTYFLGCIAQAHTLLEPVRFELFTDGIIGLSRRHVVTSIKHVSTRQQLFLQIFHLFL